MRLGIYGDAQGATDGPRGPSNVYRAPVLRKTMLCALYAKCLCNRGARGIDELRAILSEFKYTQFHQLQGLMASSV
eukprot:11195715-Lingulodinium_polyedra.AAC.1